MGISACSRESENDITKVEITVAEGIDESIVEEYDFIEELDTQWNHVRAQNPEVFEEAEISPQDFNYLVEIAEDPESQRQAFVLQHNDNDEIYSIIGYMDATDKNLNYINIIPGEPTAMTWGPQGDYLTYGGVISSSSGLNGFYMDNIQENNNVISIPQEVLVMDNDYTFYGIEETQWFEEEVFNVQIQFEDGEGNVKTTFGHLKMNGGERPVFIFSEDIVGYSRVWDVSEKKILFTSSVMVEKIEDKWAEMTKGNEELLEMVPLEPSAFQTARTAIYNEEVNGFVIPIRGPYVTLVDYAGVAYYDLDGDELYIIDVMFSGELTDQNLAEGNYVFSPDGRYISYTLATAVAHDNSLVVVDIVEQKVKEVYHDFQDQFKDQGIEHVEPLVFYNLSWNDENTLEFVAERLEDEIFNGYLNMEEDSLLLDDLDTE